MTIFLIEMDSPFSNMMRYQLMQLGSQVQAFPSVSECFYFMQKKYLPDFLVADLTALEQDPSSFLHQVRNGFPGVRVVFLSPYDDNSIPSRLMEEGASDYIHTSGRMEEWVLELTKNLEYLAQEAR
jgi:DNA-binding NarL/FixJ family response regulator